MTTTSPSTPSSTPSATSPADELAAADATSPPTAAPPARLSARVVGRIAAWYALCRASRVLFVAQTASWAHSHVSVYLALTRWDSSWYGAIAEHGYPPAGRASLHGNAWAFFPMWPMLIRALHAVAGGSWQRNGLFLAFVLGFTAALCVWLAVADVFDARIADRTVLLFLFLPSTFTLSMVYTESLFVTAAALCLYALRRKWWIVAGVAAAVGSATRIPGLVLFVCCAVAAATEIWEHRSAFGHRLRDIVMPLLAPLLAPLGLLAFVVWQWHRVGTPVEFVKAEKVWHNDPEWGLAVIRTFRHLAFSAQRWATPTDLVVAVLIVFSLAGFVAMGVDRRRIPWSWWIFSLGIIAFAVVPTILGPRYFLPTFPPVAALIAHLPERWFTVVVALSTVAMCVLALLSFGAGGFLLAP